jgi:hypothetical protein
VTEVTSTEAGASELRARGVIQHLSSAFEAMKTGLTIKPEGWSEDVGQFFSLPIPRMIWKRI